MSVDSTVAARVPVDLRKDLEAVVDKWRREGRHYPDGREVDLSFVQRHAFRSLTDRELGRDDADLFPYRGEDVTAELEQRGGSARSSDPSTSKAAAAAQGPPRVGSQRWRALERFGRASLRGLTTDQVVEALEPAPQNGTARRVTDLLQGGYIEPRAIGEGDGALYTNERRHDGHVERKTRAGAWAIVWRITDKGREALRLRRQDQRDPGGRR